MGGYVPAFTVNLIIALAILILFIISLPLIIQFAINSMVRGKLLCAILGKEMPLDFKLLRTKTKEGEGEFVDDNKDRFQIDSEQIKLVWYPIMLPKMMHQFQQRVPCSLYLRGRFEPLDWKNPNAGTSSKEIKAVLDPHWLVNLIEGAKEGAPSSGMPKNMRLILMIVASMVIIGVLAVIYMATKK